MRAKAQQRAGVSMSFINWIDGKPAIAAANQSKIFFNFFQNLCFF